ncbi:MAG TPA: serine hydrolase domain-containing protein [Bacteroidales bacterium]|nr:serine hydrolase domain-containing protein [Bacteroidales bacterium]HPR11757.1 serine hydrolase domain-containing protein [Bacteroidales bacterium]HRW84095.1 serine hydrolase domain-containing protein [Bacteroidales bacterium]
MVFIVHIFCTIRSEAQIIERINFQSSLKNMEKGIESLRCCLNIPGISAAIVSSDTVLWVKSFGYSDVEKAVPASPETIYPLASLTKPFSAMVLLSLEEKGILDLYEPVYPYIRDFLVKYSIPHNANSFAPVTVSHLLSHTSDFPPGTYFRYDGDRFSVLSEIATKATGLSWEELLRNYILNPAGMNSTFTFNEDPEDKRALLAMPYSYEHNNVIKGEFLTQVNAAVGLRSSVVDLIKLCQGILNQQLLTEETCLKMFEPAMLRTNNTVGYGRGWFLDSLNDHRVVWHNGYGLSASGLIIILPEDKLAFIILANSNRISSPFPVGIPGINIGESPFARLFLEAATGSIDRIKGSFWEKRDNWRIAHVSGNHDEEFLTHLFQDDNCCKSIEINHNYRLISLLKVNGKDHFITDFNLPEARIVRILAIADGGYCDYFGMYDSVWIESLDDQQRIWEMTAGTTTYAGGHPRNRKYDGSFYLPNGRYRIHFDNSKSNYDHYKGHWEALPPDDNFWGVSVYEFQSAEKHPGKTKLEN